MADFLEAGHLVALLLLLLLAAFVLARLQIVARIYIIAALITVLVATSCSHRSWYKFKVLLAAPCPFAASLVLACFANSCCIYIMKTVACSWTTINGIL